MVMLNGKLMLTEALAFSKISDADFGDEGSLLKPRRQSMQGNTFDVLIAFGHNLRGQTGACISLMTMFQMPRSAHCTK